MQYIGRLERNKMGKYGRKAITDEVVLTDEILNEHILVKHFKEYQELKE